MERPSPALRASHVLFVAAALLFGAPCFVIAWLGASVRFGDRAGWMAPVAALTAIALLRATRSSPGSARAVLATIATAGYLALGEWIVACLPIAAGMGQSPLEAAQRMGTDFGWMLIRLGNSPLDWGWMVLAIAMAALLGR
jgi:hypothetical protein